MSTSYTTFGLCCVKSKSKSLNAWLSMSPVSISHVQPRACTCNLSSAEPTDLLQRQYPRTAFSKSPLRAPQPPHIPDQSKLNLTITSTNGAYSSQWSATVKTKTHRQTGPRSPLLRVKTYHTRDTIGHLPGKQQMLNIQFGYVGLSLRAGECKETLTAVAL